MTIKKSDLDKRICDVESQATNTETYREYLVASYREIFQYEVEPSIFDKMTEEEINDRIEEVDYLWWK